MKILVAHNSYRNPGGEDRVFENEVELLREHGHDVITWTESNDDLAPNPIVAGSNAIWSGEAYEKALALLESHRPDVVHFHNIFFKISPSAYYAAAKVGIPVVQTIHNYRLICPKATLFRDGGVCEDCVAKTLKWPAVLHRCYRDSRLESAGVSAVLAFHQLRSTWTSKVDVFVALTSFMKEKMAQGGIEGSRIEVKPNFVLQDLGMRNTARDYFLFAGRLEEEKGILTVLTAWEQLADIPLLIAGEGSLEGKLSKWRSSHPHAEVEDLGWIPRSELLGHLRECLALIVPSRWYEGLPMTVLEAFACGVPVIAARRGAMEEIITDGVDGLLYSPDDPRDLALKVRMLKDKPEVPLSMGRAARSTYEREYGPGRNYEQLMAIYTRAMRDHESPMPGGA